MAFGSAKCNIIRLWRGSDGDTVVWFISVRYGVPRNHIRTHSQPIPPLHSFIALRNNWCYQFPLFFCNRTNHGNAAPCVICFPYHLRFHPWKQTPSKFKADIHILNPTSTRLAPYILKLTRSKQKPVATNKRIIRPKYSSPKKPYPNQNQCL